MSAPIAPGGLGRIPVVDDRDRAYTMRALLASAPPAGTRLYNAGAVLDQGRTGTCVGHSWRQWLSSALIMTKGGPDAFAIYRRACLLDTWPDNDTGDLDWGTSVRAGAKALQEAGHISEYRWAWDADVVAAWLLAGRGCVVLGTDWHEDMSNPDKGVIQPTGPIQGGHAYLCVGYSGPRDAFRILNSWSRGWSDNGRAWLPRWGLAQLLRQGGEACSAVEVRLV